MTDTYRFRVPPEPKRRPKGSKVKVVRSQTIKCPPLTDSVQKWFDSLWSFDPDSAAELYAKNFNRFKAEELDFPFKKVIDRGCYLARVRGEPSWEHAIKLMDKSPRDLQRSSLWCYCVMLRFGKYRGIFLEEDWMGYGSVCRVLHGLDISLFGGEIA